VLRPCFLVELQVVDDSSISGAKWVGPTCEIAVSRRLPGATVKQLFKDSNPNLLDHQIFLTTVAAYLTSHPNLVEAWQQYSWDKRVSSGPYLDGLEVGRYEHGRQEIHFHADPVSACADFIYREATSSLGR
jgi:hypothetical protein